MSLALRPTISKIGRVAIYADDLHYAARLIAPEREWSWLRSLKSRLQARARRQDRFDRLVPPWDLLELGILLMDGSEASTALDRKSRDLQYRDGLLIALLSVWPIRRRSIAALSVSRHIRSDPDGIALTLYPEDTKSKRRESFRVPIYLVSRLRRYLQEVRPHFPGALAHDGLWASSKGCPLKAGRIYDIFRARIAERFGKQMCLHDVRRAAATFLATTAPEIIGIVPGVLQHRSPEVGERHYNLARSTEASRRHRATVSELRARLAPVRRSSKG